ncbi:hypothetical protein Avbf_14515, partial [Armadillidium vulgare]
MRKNNKYIF